MEELIKGRLKLPEHGVDVPFTLLPVSTSRSIYGRIGNTAEAQVFDGKAGWVFEPDAPPLPTFVGYYTRKSNLTPGGRLINVKNLYRRDERGYWYLDGTPIWTETMHQRHADDPFVLLSVNKA